MRVFKLKALLRWANAAVGILIGAAIGTFLASASVNLVVKDPTNWLGLGPVGALLGALVLGPLFYLWLAERFQRQ